MHRSRLAALAVLILMLVCWAWVAAIDAQGAPVKIAIVYAGGGALSGPLQIKRAIAGLGDAVQVDVYAPGEGGIALTNDTDLTHYDVVLTDAAVDVVIARLPPLQRAKAATKLVVVNPKDSVLQGNVPLEQHPDLPVYWKNLSHDNYAGLVKYLAARVANSRLISTVPPPIDYGEHGFYHPDAPSRFEALEAYLDWYGRTEAGRATAGADKYMVGLSIPMHYYQHRDTADIDALIRAVEARGHRIATIYSHYGVDFEHYLVRDGRPVVDVLMYLGGNRLNLFNQEEGKEQARRLGVPVLGLLRHLGSTPAEYAASYHGLAPTMVEQLAGYENDSIFETMAISGRGKDPQVYEIIPGQAEWRVDRALAWARLRRLSNSGKRVVFTFMSNDGDGKANLGADPDDFLDVPGSLVHLMDDMKARGYDVGSATLPTRDTLARRMVDEASNVNTWEAGALAGRVARREVVLLPEARYRTWYNAIPAKRRAEIEAVWGPPPGDVMTYRNPKGEKFLVIPRLEFGNILIAPHPYRGFFQKKEVLMSREAIPPHHQYMAFFLWLQKEWRADAWVSMFTNIDVQLGKSVGPLADDHIGILLGSLPNIHPERLGASGGIFDKRKGMAYTPSWFNIVVRGGKLETLQRLEDALKRYDGLASDELRAASQTNIRKEVKDAGLERALELDAATVEFVALRERLDSYLALLARETMPEGSKVLGDAPRGRALAEMVAGMLGREFLKALEPRTPAAIEQAAVLTAAVLNGRTPTEAVRDVLETSDPTIEALLARVPEYASRLLAAPRERAAILEALDARWLEPSPADDPMRRPDAVPPGRHMYNYDTSVLPSVEAEALGREQAVAMIERYQKEHGGAFPKQFGFVMFTSDYGRDSGATSAQMMYLLGVRPVRNEQGQVTGVALIPRAELGRPRIDNPPDRQWSVSRSSAGEDGAHGPGGAPRGDQSRARQPGRRAHPIGH